MSERYDVELRIVSDPRYLCVVRGAISAAVDKLGFDEGACAQVMLAVDEAVSNIMRHGYGGRTDRPIWVRLASTGDERRPAFRIVIEDEAAQVDPEHIRGRDLDDVRPGGLGVHIIRQVMDDVRFDARPEGGMRLTMTKAATPADTANADAPRTQNPGTPGTPGAPDA